ncbi:hypothetical protein NBRC116187_24600 [Halopseudomonas sabulinigri]|uniref:Uncharacterized protein n=1 Tax=Halopseudomonas sabulinigri TaxID=472181 RepID=A0ABP9ZRK0_9GAMM
MGRLVGPALRYQKVLTIFRVLPFLSQHRKSELALRWPGRTALASASQACLSQEGYPRPA